MPSQRTQIEAAFADVPYPGDDNLYDGWQLDDDYDDVIRNLMGKHWRDLIPRRKPPRGRETPLTKDLIFCSPAVWHFFLPTYLIAAVMRGEVSPHLFDPAWPGRMTDRFSRLNAAQCAALAAFLVYADALLVENAAKMPQHSAYFARDRQELAPVADYWQDRVRQET